MLSVSNFKAFAETRSTRANSPKVTMFRQRTTAVNRAGSATPTKELSADEHLRKIDERLRGSAERSRSAMKLRKDRAAKFFNRGEECYDRASEIKEKREYGRISAFMS